MRLAVLCLVAFAALPPLSDAQAPVIVITPEGSSVNFFVKASVDLQGSFNKWDATLKFTSPDLTTGVLDIKIRAASVNTGSRMKNYKLKGKDFFNVNQDPFITFLSRKVVQTGPYTFDAQGDFTIRGVTKPETLILIVSPEGKGSAEIKGTMAFDRREYGMNSGIPFMRIADRVEITVDLNAKQVSGLPLVYKR